MAAVAAIAVAVPVFVVATALPAGAVDVGDATDLASHFNDASVTAVTMTADITIDCGHLLDRTSANPIVLDGAGHTLTQGCASSRVINGNGLGALTLRDITVTGGHSSANGGGIHWDADVTVINSHITENTTTASGGGLYADGVVTITGSTFATNTANNSGGGAFSEVSLSAVDSIFTDNAAGGGAEGCDCSGGGFYSAGPAFVSGSMFANNEATDCNGGCGASGGGFFAVGGTTVAGSSFTSNRAGDCEECAASGGGFYTNDEAAVSDTSFDLNSAGNCGDCGGEGGGFESHGDTPVTNATFTQNFAGQCSSCGGDGGGLYVFDGVLTLTGSTFTENSVECAEACNGIGGGALILGGANVLSSVFQGNSVNCTGACSGAQGGGLYVSGPLVNRAERGSHELGDIDAQVEGFGTLSVSHSAFTGNRATCATSECEAGGGGIVADHVDPVSIDHSTMSGNTTVGVGGAIIIRFGGVDATITNSTITANASASLGAVVSFGASTLTLVYDTIVANTVVVPANPEGAAAQAAVDSVNVHVDGDLTSVATVIALPIGGVNCSKSNGGTQTSQGYNFADDLTCGFTNTATGDRQGAGLPPIALGALSDNGGIGETMLPQPTSPLLDFIPTSACRTGSAAGVTDDERGVSRPQGPGCEIGAAEVEVVAPPVAIQPNFTG